MACEAREVVLWVQWMEASVVRLCVYVGGGGGKNRGVQGRQQAVHKGASSKAGAYAHGCHGRVHGAE